MAFWQSRIVYFEATGVLAAANQNQGLWITAVADAAEGATYIADQDNIDAVEGLGTGALRVSAGEVSVPHIAVPGRAWYDAANNVLKTTPLIEFPLRNAHQKRHELLDTLSDILEDRHPIYGKISRFFPAEDITKGHDIIFRLHQMGYLVGHKQVSVNGGTTKAHQLAWIAAAAQGPTDAGFSLANPLSYFDIAHTVATPTGPFSIVDITDLSRRTLGTAVTEVVAVGGPGQPAEPTPAQLRKGAWIRNINE